MIDKLDGVTEKVFSLLLTLKGELEDVQEVTAPESSPGGVSAAGLSLSTGPAESDTGSSGRPPQ